MITNNKDGNTIGSKKAINMAAAENNLVMDNCGVKLMSPKKMILVAKAAKETKGLKIETNNYEYVKTN